MAPIHMTSDRMKAELFAICIATLFLLSVLSTVAEAKGKPSFVNDQQGDKWVLKNDQISIWFQGKKPMLKVFRTGEDGSKTGYMLKIQQVFEKDKDGITMAVVNLESARSQDWTVSSEQGIDSTTLTMSGEITQTGAMGGSGLITFVFHIDTSSSEAKFDVVVDDWQWKSADKDSATLALKLLVVNEVLRERADDSVSVGSVGYVKWAATAKADGENVSVAHEVGVEGGATHLILTFESSGSASKLEYDPTVGVTKASSGGSASSVGAIGAIVTVAAAAAVVARRRK